MPRTPTTQCDIPSAFDMQVLRAIDDFAQYSDDGRASGYEIFNQWAKRPWGRMHLANGYGDQKRTSHFIRRSIVWQLRLRGYVTSDCGKPVRYGLSFEGQEVLVQWKKRGGHRYSYKRWAEEIHGTL